MPNGAPSASSASMSATGVERRGHRARRGGPARTRRRDDSGGRGLRERIARQHPGVIGNAAAGGECLLAADRDAPEAAVDRIGGARRAAPAARAPAGTSSSSWRLKARSRTGASTSSSGARVRSATSKRTWSLPAAVQPWAIMLVPSLRAMCAMVCACMTRSAPTQSGYIWPRLHVAHDEEAQHLLEIVRARIDLVMRDGAQRAGALGQRARRGRIDAAGVDGHGDDRAAGGSPSATAPGRRCRGRRNRRGRWAGRPSWERDWTCLRLGSWPAAAR